MDLQWIVVPGIYTANEMRVVVRVVGFLLSMLLSSAKNLMFSTFLAVSYSHESKGCRLNLKIWLTLITTINDPNLINNDWSSLSMYQFQPTCILYYPFTIFSVPFNRRNLAYSHHYYQKL